jgi:uncharacterized membrane protein YdjX (TVP38/TMEM64 family)
MNKSLAFRLVFLLLLVGLSIFIFLHFDIQLLFKDRQRLLAFIRSYPNDQLIFIAVQIIQVVAAPIPGELTGIIGGMLYGPFWGTVYSTIGLMLGSWAAFMLARFFGEPLLGYVVSQEVFKKFDHFMEHKGLLVSFLLFLIPGFPKDYLCYIMGVSRIPAGMFLAISTAGRVFGTAMLSITGSFAGNGQYSFLIVVLIIGVALFVTAYYYRDRLIDLLKKMKR